MRQELATLITDEFCSSDMLHVCCLVILFVVCPAALCLAAHIG